MSRFPDTPIVRRDYDMSWAGPAAGCVAVLVALIVLFFRGKSIGLW
jgi:hypothetical protein